MNGFIEAFINFFKTSIPAELIIFIISLLPILELRGGMIAASILGVPWHIAFPICLIGNMLPMPIILLFIRKIFDFIKKTNFLWLSKLVTKLDEKAEKKSKTVDTASALGLFMFVAIPLPGTGGWTGALVANTLNVKFSRAIWIICLGILGAGLIMSVLTYFIPSLFF